MKRTPQLAVVVLALASFGLIGAACTPAPTSPGPTPTEGCFKVDLLAGTSIRHKVVGKQYRVYADAGCTTTPTFGPFNLIYAPNYTTTDQEVQQYCDYLNPPGTTNGYHAGAHWIPAQPGWMTCQPLA
ncbi:MAG: hypothetical protein ACK5O2_00665 [Microthrixaceae bacterium]